MGRKRVCGWHQANLFFFGPGWAEFYPIRPSTFGLFQMEPKARQDPTEIPRTKLSSEEEQGCAPGPQEGGWHASAVSPNLGDKCGPQNWNFGAASLKSPSEVMLRFPSQMSFSWLS